MLEVEMKFPLRDFAAVESRLATSAARQISTRQDIDQYFNAPDRDFGCVHQRPTNRSAVRT